MNWTSRNSERDIINAEITSFQKYLGTHAGRKSKGGRWMEQSQDHVQHRALDLVVSVFHILLPEK
jgi:hypothetical protein